MNKILRYNIKAGVHEEFCDHLRDDRYISLISCKTYNFKNPNIGHLDIADKRITFENCYNSNDIINRLKTCAYVSLTPSYKNRLFLIRLDAIRPFTVYGNVARLLGFEDGYSLTSNYIESTKKAMCDVEYLKVNLCNCVANSLGGDDFDCHTIAVLHPMDGFNYYNPTIDVSHRITQGLNLKIEVIDSFGDIYKDYVVFIELLVSDVQKHTKRQGFFRISDRIVLDKGYSDISLVDMHGYIDNVVFDKSFKLWCDVGNEFKLFENIVLEEYRYKKLDKGFFRQIFIIAGKPVVLDDFPKLHFPDNGEYVLFFRDQYLDLNNSTVIPSELLYTEYETYNIICNQNDNIEQMIYRFDHNISQLNRNYWRWTKFDIGMINLDFRVIKYFKVFEVEKDHKESSKTKNIFGRLIFK